MTFASADAHYRQSEKQAAQHDTELCAALIFYKAAQLCIADKTISGMVQIFSRCA